jgi:hypothetical protein
METTLFYLVWKVINDFQEGKVDLVQGLDVDQLIVAEIKFLQ